MNDLTVLVLARPTSRYLARLERLPDSVRIVVGDRPEAFRDAAAEADVLFTCMMPRDLVQEVFRMTRRLRWMHSLSTGVDNALFPEIRESPIPLTNSRGLFSRPLAEFCLAAMFYFAKDFRRMNRAQEAGRWEPFDVEELHGRTVGIVGYGSIGQWTARLAHAVGMRVVAMRRRPELSVSDALIDAVYSPQRLVEMLAICDYIVVAAPLTAETRGMIDENAFPAMKRSAVLINVGRGPVVSESALAAALEHHQIRGAALDVFESEPLPAGHPFYKFDNVLLSPHCADHVPGWAERAVDLFCDNFERFRKGESLANLVDKEAGY